MSARRANLLAAAVLAGATVAPLAAQQPPINQNASSFEVLPPRRLALPSLPFGGESQEMTVGFFSPQQNPTNGQPPPQPRPAPQQQQPMVSGPTVMPLFGKPQTQPQAQPGKPAFPALTAATPAPAWRWHGYGSTKASGEAQPMTPHVMTGPLPNPGLANIEMSGPITLPMPTQMPMPMPAGPVLQSGPTMPTPMPAAAPLPSYSRPGPAIEAVPIQQPAGDAIWKPSGGGRIGAVPTNPMTANEIQPVSFVAARPTDNAISRAAAFVPAAAAPAPAATPVTAQSSLAALRTTIETVCSGKGRDLDMYFRSPNHLLIRMTVRQAADAELLANTISKLPEITPYHVVFEMAVAP